MPPTLSIPTASSTLTVPLSPSTSPKALGQSTSTTSFFADISDCSSSSDDDEDDRVFFGTPSSAETRLVQKLSAPSPMATPRATRARRISKRDSREFMRRKTMLVLPLNQDEEEEKDEGEERKVWPGGFHERINRSPAHSEDSSASSSLTSSPSRSPGYRGTPRSIAGGSDLTSAFARFNLSTPKPIQALMKPTQSPAPPAISPEKSEREVETSEEEEDEFTDDGNEESDKENAPLPVPDEEGDEEEKYELFQGPVTGHIDCESEVESSDAARTLNIGGLSLSDFDDPDMGHAVAGAYLATSDFEYSSKEASEHGSVSDEELEVLDQEDQTIQIPTEVEEFDEAGNIPEEQVAEEGKASAAVEEMLESPRAAQSEEGSPLPMPRAGPVVIPAIPHFMESPAQAGSSSDESPTSEFPTSPTPLHLNSPSDLLPLTTTVITSPAYNSSHSTPTTQSSHALQPKQTLMTSAVSKSSSSLTSSAMKPRVPSTRDLPPVIAEERKENIKAQFAALASGAGPPVPASQSVNGGKLGLGAPSRSASNSSSASSGVQKPGQRSVSSISVNKVNVTTATSINRTIKSLPTNKKIAPTIQVRPASSIPRPGSSASTSSNGSKVAATKPKAQPTFARKPVTVPITVSRPPLVSRSIPPQQPTVRGSYAPPAKAARPPMSRPAPSMQPMHTTVKQSPVSQPKSLKRPLPTAQAIQPRAVLAASVIPSRPGIGLGLPARVVGDQVFTLSSSRAALSPRSDNINIPVLQEVSVFGGGIEEPLFSEGCGTFVALGLGKAVRSPARMMFPSSAVKATPMSVRASRVGTPSKMRTVGTPSLHRSFGTPSRPISTTPSRNQPKFQVLSNVPQDTSTTTPANPAIIPESDGPPATNTRQATDAAEVEAALGLGTILGGPRGSSEDHEEVSFAIPVLPSSSDVGSSPLSKATRNTRNTQHNQNAEVDLTPVDEEDIAVNISTHHGRDVHPSKIASMIPTAILSNIPALPSLPFTNPSRATPGDRPKRSIKPPQPPTIFTRPTIASLISDSIAPGISEKELKSKTVSNTRFNEKYHCAIERQNVIMNCPRPPSPTSKIPTTEQREEEAKKRDRELRMKRRKAGSANSSSDVEGENEDEEPLVKRLEGKEVRWQGDEDGWQEEDESEERPTKKMRLGSGRRIKWDTGVVVIRDNGKPFSLPSKNMGSGKSSLKFGKQVELDHYGNVLASRPKEHVKPHRIVVYDRVYEGEEPVVPIAQTTRGKKKSG